jgi:hypothetical protein
LRQLLKIALRRFEFVCVDAREETSEIPAQPESGRAIPEHKERES